MQIIRERMALITASVTPCAYLLGKTPNHRKNETFGYFKHAISGTFRTIDGFVRRRLRAILRKREKRLGHSGTRQDHQRWPNSFFAAHGLFTLHEAYMQASQSR